eukprot:8895587-Lingulodinium_polyedra.AAC.1
MPLAGRHGRPLSSSLKSRTARMVQGPLAKIARGREQAASHGSCLRAERGWRPGIPLAGTGPAIE